MRDSREEGDDYAEGYAVGETHQRTDIRRVELVKKERKKEIYHQHMTLLHALLLLDYTQ